VSPTALGREVEEGKKEKEIIGRLGKENKWRKSVRRKERKEFTFCMERF
jgi:hypothetical protein